MEDNDPALARYTSIPRGGGAPAAPARDTGAVPVSAEVDHLSKRFPSLAPGLRKEAAEQAGKDRLPPELARRYSSIPQPKEDGAAADPSAPAALEIDAPEGIDPKSATWTEYRTAAAELGLDKEKAGKLVELYQRDRQEQGKAWDRQVDAWFEECTKDAEISAGVGDAREVVNEFGGRELVDLLDASGYGNHPALVRTLVRIAGALKSARRGW